MTALDDLREGILADLDNDEPRLVYADALQAAGDPSGGYDRTRVGSWGSPPGTLAKSCRRDWIGDAFADTSDPKRVATLRGREKKLLPEYRAVWAYHLPIGYRFGRGFVDHVYGRTNPDVLAGKK